MSFYRLVLTSLLALGGPAIANAVEVSMAGDVRFTIPVKWVDIMQVDGDPQVRVFQVPNPTPNTGDTLARVSVTVKQVANTREFSDYVNGALAKAKNLKDYQTRSRAPGGQNDFVYTASESGTPYTYTEYYWFRHGHAIQLRCARPSGSQAGPAWAANFDQDCRDIAAHLNQ